MKRNLIQRMMIALGVASGLTIGAAAGRGQEAGTSKPAQKPHTDAKINHPFRNPDVKAYVKRFEAESRENYAHRHEIVAALGLEAGMSIADVGAGTGLFTRLFAEKVGPRGKVYAVDISQPFLDHIAEDARKQKLKQIETIRCTQESTKLPPNSVDVVFLSDVYHHLEHPEKTLETIHRALRPEGKLIVIEFDRVEGRSSSFVLKHVRASQSEFRKEIEGAGFAVIATPNAPRLKENFFLQFEKKPRTQSRDARN